MQRLIVLVAFSYVISSVAVDAEVIIRKTESGKIRGTVTSLAQVFYGIRYAAPAGRWDSPSRPIKHSGIYNATFPRAQCYQSPCMTTDVITACLKETSEDCLYLNIFAPLGTKSKKKKPVMVYLHGGNFVENTGGATVFNAEKMAELGNVIVVTINYRLGLFGFMVNGNDTGDIRGNYGLQDQRQALQWVRKNIKKFGGNKNKVTLFGQSAGAYSVLLHLTSGKADPLFQRAIIESSPTSIPMSSLQAAINNMKVPAAFLNCSISNTTCLKEKTSEEVLQAQNVFRLKAAEDGLDGSFLRRFMPIMPHVDGDEVPYETIEAFRTGQFSKKPVIWGSTTEEAWLYIYSGFTNPVSASLYGFLLFLLEPFLADESLALYPTDSFSDNREVMSELTTDHTFACPNRLLARIMSNAGSPSYMYKFNNALSIDGLMGVTECDGKACHGVNVPYVFQSARIPPLVFSAEEFALSDKMICHYTNFAYRSNPNKPKKCKGPSWPSITDTDDYTLFFNQTKSFVTAGDRSEFCDFWDMSDYKG